MHFAKAIRNRSHSPIKIIWLSLLSLLLGLCSGISQAGGEEAAPDKKYYLVTDGKVDPSTFMGWRVFHMNCHSCHGVDATGTELAPDLRERIKTMSPETFADKVLKRYRITVSQQDMASEGGSAVRDALLEEMQRQKRGSQGEIIMPGWEEFNPGIKPHILDLYGYLKARADGALGPGRPGLLK